MMRQLNVGKPAEAETKAAWRTFRLPVALGVRHAEVLLHLLHELHAQTPHAVGVGHAQQTHLLRLLAVRLAQLLLQQTPKRGVA